MQSNKNKVTREQFIEVIINNTDGKNNIELAAELGISKGQFYRYQDEYAIRSKDEVRKIVQRWTGEMLQLLRKSARKGSDRAIQLLMEIGDTYTPSNKIDVKGTVSVLYAVGLIKTPIDAGLSDSKQIKNSEQKQLKQANKVTP